ncbi:hypothetical protein A2U01_0095468, partial [Trifolium medium]|nr:hypothetical protein [Trifolium medium]
MGISGGSFAPADVGGGGGAGCAFSGCSSVRFL